MNESDLDVSYNVIEVVQRVVRIFLNQKDSEEGIKPTKVLVS